MIDRPTNQPTDRQTDGPGYWEVSLPIRDTESTLLSVLKRFSLLIRLKPLPVDLKRVKKMLNLSFHLLKGGLIVQCCAYSIHYRFKLNASALLYIQRHDTAILGEFCAYRGFCVSVFVSLNYFYTYSQQHSKLIYPWQSIQKEIKTSALQDR